jgi:hypothetical protein
MSLQHACQHSHQPSLSHTEGKGVQDERLTHFFPAESLPFPFAPKPKNPFFEPPASAETEPEPEGSLKTILTIPARSPSRKVLFLRRQDRDIFDMLPGETLLIVTFHECEALDEVSLAGAV